MRPGPPASAWRWTSSATGCGWSATSRPQPRSRWSRCGPRARWPPLPTTAAPSASTTCPAVRSASWWRARARSRPAGSCPDPRSRDRARMPLLPPVTSTLPAMSRTFWVETLGCPKNQVDTDKLTGTMLADGLVPAGAPEHADLVVVNTCAFIEEARRESVDVILDLADRKAAGAELVVTGCMAERYGDELASALPEADAVVGFGVPVTLGPTRTVPEFDLLNLARPAAAAPWAYVKVAEGCDRACGFCAIPSFRGRQRSREFDSVLSEVSALAEGGVREIVLVAQDLAAYGRDQGRGTRAIVPLVGAVAARVDRVRLLYLYPSDLTDGLIEAICATGVPYFDLSLQHASGRLLRRMRRWGDGGRFLSRIEQIRTA